MFKLISFLFHPFSFLLLGIIIFFNTNTYINFSYSSQLKFLIYSVVFINTMLMPVLLTWYLSNKGYIDSIQMERLSDRKIIYVITFIFYIACMFMLSTFGVPGIIYKYSFGAAMTVGVLFVMALLNKKLSAHMAATGGLTGALAMISIKLQTDLITLISAMILLSGLIGMSRIILKAHKENEVYWGFVLGFLSQVFIYS